MNKENGRSMVEMLGVLAIIGVLSAGALAGYSKAMFRHRVNQTIEEVALIFQKFIEIENKDWGNDVIAGVEDLQSLGLLTNCTKGRYGCKLPIGEISGYFERCVFPDAPTSYCGEWELYLHNAKQCVAFLSIGWENIVPQDWFIPNGQIMVNGYKIYYPTGHDDDTPITEMSISDITEACRNCEERTSCYIAFVIGNYL